MDENTIQNTSKNKKTKIIIIAIIVIALVSVAAIILLTTLNKGSGIKENQLSSEEDVIKYLEEKYNGEIFSIAGKDEYGWKVNSESGSTFYVRMTKDEYGNKIIKDGYTDLAIYNAVRFFESNYFTAKVDLSDHSIDLYDGDSLIDISNASDDAKQDILRLCVTITAYRQFKALNTVGRLATIVTMHTADENTPIKCMIGKDTFEELLR